MFVQEEIDDLKLLMPKVKSAAALAEMRRLYFEESLTLQEIAAIFGVTREAVRALFVRHGIEILNKRRGRKIHRTLDRETLIQLYVVEKKPIAEIFRELHTTKEVLKRELKRHEIEIRLPSALHTRDASLGELMVGEKMIVTLRRGGKDPSYIYRKAKKLGIKITATRIDENSFQVTRVR